jgi:serine aminopeptidase S33 family
VSFKADLELAPETGFRGLASPRLLGAAPPRRPPAWQERLGNFFLIRFAPRLQRIATPPPPPMLAPFERFAIPRRGRRPGELAATWFPAPGAARGSVLLVHPWIEWGQAYFHRHGRIQALRAAGYHALTFDLGGFGDSGPVAGFYEHDVEDALAALRARAPGLALHVWGISAGGTWAHPVLARAEDLAGAMFEDVSPHLIEWSRRLMPEQWPAYLCFERLAPRAFRYIDMRRHAPALGVRAAAYASGALDPGVTPLDTRELARLTGAETLIVPGAGHLAAIKLARREVLALALRTFERAEESARRG